MSFGQGGPDSRWDPWTPHSQQPQQPQQPQPQEPWSGGGETPDWAALAEASEARAKRRRLLFIGGGALATVAVAAAVAVAVVSANGSGSHANGPSGSPTTADLPSESASAPSFAPTSAPPPLDPKDFVSSKKKDTAPLGAEILFPGTRLTMGETVYEKGLLADTGACASAAQKTLPKVLTDNGCTRLMRVTYANDDVAVTLGVAVFDTEAQAKAAKSQTDKRSIVSPLAGGGVPSFCTGAICRSTINSYGRYAYFTISGFTTGRNVTTRDTKVYKAGDDLAEFAFRQIRQRGEAQASAAAVGE